MIVLNPRQVSTPSFRPYSCFFGRSCRGKSILRSVRWSSSKPPIFSRTGNIIVDSLKYVKDVDAYQDKITKQTPEQQLAEELISRIGERPQLLSLLSLFHFHLASIGITPASARTFTRRQVWQYRFLYVTRLAKIYNIFWEECRFLDLAQREHKLGFSPSDIGVLDPSHFNEQVYKQLQQGSYNNVDFRNVQAIGSDRFSK